MVTEVGEGRILDVYPLRQSVVVELDGGERREFPSDDLQPWDELEALRRKSQQPCERNENGDCDCNKDVSTPTEETTEDYGEVEENQPAEKRPNARRTSVRRSKKSRRKKTS